MMTKIFLIGNGFDLAHGLKTSYTDFILWYFNQLFEKLNEKVTYKDDLLELQLRRQDTPLIKYPCDSIRKLREVIKSDKLNYSPSNFFNNLIERKIRYNWVDIETEYYQSLVQAYKIIEHHGVSGWDSYITNIQNLNNSFACLKQNLHDYLITLDRVKNLDDSILQHFDRIACEDNRIQSEFVIINFNYTDTIRSYTRMVKAPHTLIDIHGSLSNKHNPIIFGYGDEMESFYQKIENLNHNDSLKYMKSFSYFQADKYHQLNGYLEAAPYEVYIMGHSCGISDRVLLNHIFENKNCRKIEIFYHKIDEEQNDYFEKTIEISRHFKNKIFQRSIIVPFPKCRPLKFDTKGVLQNSN